MEKYPMLMQPYCKQTVWGGNRLKDQYGKGDFDSLGEAWELSCRKEESSVIANGPCKGLPLYEYEKHRGKADDFPILIKFIDSASDLSVQVHPGSSDALLEVQRPKTEMWYIIDADSNAEIVYGLKNGVTAEEFETACLKGANINCCLNRIPVHSGDVYFIPSGQVHAIGKGILLAEIQQNSDTTFRLYDYDRKDKNGKTRELQIEQGLKSVKGRSCKEINSLRFNGDFKNKELPDSVCLTDCEFFSCDLVTLTEKSSVELKASKEFFAIVCVCGNGKLICNSSEFYFGPLETYYVPSGCAPVKISGDAKLLCVSCKDISAHSLDKIQ